jgi:predicted transcriptional regulator of viral defense system
MGSERDRDGSGSGGGGSGRIYDHIRRSFDPTTPEEALVALALAQHDVFTTGQLDAIGLSARAVQHRAGRSKLHRLYHGVYSLVPRELLTSNGHRMAAVLACGEGAALSHQAAAEHLGLMTSSRTHFDVTVPTRGGRRRSGIQIHRSSTFRPDVDVTLVDGIPTTTVDRTIFDLADVLSPRRVERVLDEAAYLEVLDVARLDEQMEHNQGRGRAVGRLRKVLAKHRPGTTRTDGPIGEMMLAITRAVGLPDPETQVYVDLGDGEPMIQPDFLWREAKVILETDGRQAHGQPLRTRADYRRDQRTARAGYQTLRVTGAQIKDEPARLGATLLALVTSRSAAAGPGAREAAA